MNSMLNVHRNSQQYQQPEYQKVRSSRFHCRKISCSHMFCCRTDVPWFHQSALDAVDKPSCED